MKKLFLMLSMTHLWAMDSRLTEKYLQTFANNVATYRTENCQKYNERMENLNSLIKCNVEWVPYSTAKQHEEYNTRRLAENARNLPRLLARKRDLEQEYDDGLKKLENESKDILKELTGEPFEYKGYLEYAIVPDAEDTTIEWLKEYNETIKNLQESLETSEEKIKRYGEQSANFAKRMAKHRGEDLEESNKKIEILNAMGRPVEAAKEDERYDNVRQKLEKESQKILKEINQNPMKYADYLQNALVPNIENTKIEWLKEYNKTIKHLQEKVKKLKAEEREQEEYRAHVRELNEERTREARVAKEREEKNITIITERLFDLPKEYYDFYKGEKYIQDVYSVRRFGTLNQMNGSRF
jgi:hypothetical protein